MKKYGWIIVLGAFLCIVLGIFLRKEQIPDISQLKFNERLHGMEFKPYHNADDDIYYLFLPSFVNMDQVEILKPDDIDVCFTSKDREYDNNLMDVPTNEPLTLIISTKKSQCKRYRFRIKQSRNISTLYIETGDGGMENVNLNKENVVKASVITINADGDVKFTGMGSITGRGNSTWHAAKKPYNLKFGQPEKLVGGSKNGLQTWCLLANAADDSQIRNALCYYIADKVGVKYTSDIDFVSLYINGEYLGLYNLATKQNYLTDADDVLAVFEMNTFDRLYDDKSDHDFYFRTRYGETEAIKKAINSFEDVLLNDDVTYSQLENYADLHSIAQKYFVDAVCALNDVGHSQYYMLDKDSVISAICAWDYDTSGGNTWIPFSFSFNAIAVTHPWYNALFRFKEFRRELLALWERHSDLLKRTTDEYARSVIDSIQNDWVMNYTRWKNYPELNPKAKLSLRGYDRNTLEDHVEYIHDLFQKRMSFLREYWSSPERFCKITFVNPESTSKKNGDRVLYCRVNDSLTSDMLPNDMYYDSEGNDITWCSDDGILIENVGTITHDMTFREKKLSQNFSLKDKMHRNLLLVLTFLVFMCLMGLLVFKTVILPIRESKK